MISDDKQKYSDSTQNLLYFFLFYLIRLLSVKFKKIIKNNNYLHV